MTISLPCHSIYNGFNEIRDGGGPEGGGEGGGRGEREGRIGG